MADKDAEINAVVLSDDLQKKLEEAFGSIDTDGDAGKASDYRLALCILTDNGGFAFAVIFSLHHAAKQSNLCLYGEIVG